MNRRVLFAAGVLVLLVALAVPSPALGKPLSEREWRRQANSVCTRFHADRGEILPTSGLSVGTPEQAQAYVAQAVPLYEELSDAIASLDEPKARTKKVKAFLRAVTAAVATIEADPLAAFSAFEDPFAEANRVARKLRLRSCDGLGDQRL